MKRIEAIIRPSRLTEVCDTLERVGYPGVTVSNVEGHGKQKGFRKINVRGRTCKVPFIDKKRVVLVVKDNEADTIIKAIREAVCTGEIGDGKIFVSPMDDAIRIRTGESGDSAV